MVTSAGHPAVWLGLQTRFRRTQSPCAEGYLRDFAKDKNSWLCDPSEGHRERERENMAINALGFKQSHGDIELTMVYSGEFW